MGDNLGYAMLNYKTFMLSQVMNEIDKDTYYTAFNISGVNVGFHAKEVTLIG